jgi:hypothetical protein
MTSKSMRRLADIRPEQNDRFSRHEQEEIVLRVDDMRSLIEPSTSHFGVPWLLVPWTATVWKTHGGKRTRKIGGEWIGTEDVDWQVQLSSGCLLTDSRYSLLLEHVRQAVARYRNGSHGGEIPSLSTWCAFCDDIRRLSSWAVWHEDRFRPEKFGLEMLDQTALRDLFTSLGKGGWTESLALIDRTLCKLFLSALGEPCPQQILDKPMNLPENVRGEISNWLKVQGAYNPRIATGGIISRTFLARLISADERVLISASNRFNAMLRQFEPDLWHEKGLLVSSNRSAELPSQRTPTIQDALSEPCTLGPAKMAAKALVVICGLRRHLPNGLPHLMASDVNYALAFAKKYSKPIGYTPFVPVNIGFRYLNEAIRWIQLYGDSLVEHYLTIAYEMNENLKGYKDRTSARSDKLPHIVKKIGVPHELKEIGHGFTRLNLNSHIDDFDEFRRAPALHQALEIWVGAVVILIAILKPSRNSEIIGLRRNCLIGEGPYWLDSELAKRSASEYRAMTDGKPVPTITAKGIQQMQRLGSGLTQLFGDGDGYSSNMLFYLPNRTFDAPKVPHANLLAIYLNRFCDYVGLPPDELGRRWYIRIHEMRKWFLLLLYWSGKYDKADVCREIAGHTDTKHIESYIQTQFPGIELSSIEAEYAADRLRQFDQTRILPDGEIGLNDLYENVLRRFNVKHLELVPSREWHPYLESMLDSGSLRIEPYLFKNEGGASQICVAFRSEEM